MLSVATGHIMTHEVTLRVVMRLVATVRAGLVELVLTSHIQWVLRLTHGFKQV